MKKLISIISAIAIVVSMFAFCFTAAADTASYRLQFTEKELTYDSTKDGWVKSPSDAAATNYAGYSYISKDGAIAIRKFVAPKDGNYKAQNWGSGVCVDNTSGLYTGATFEFAVTDKNGDIVYPTNGDVAVITEGTALNDAIDFGALTTGDVLYFVVMNPSIDNLPVVISYAFRTDDGTEFHDSGRLWGGTTQGANGWYQMYADSVTKVDLDSLAEKPYALEFETNEMIWSDAYLAWSADGTNSALIYPDATYGTTDNSLVAIRQFVMPEDGDIRLAWGAGLTTSSGTAKFAITDKTGKIIYPAEGGYVKVTTTAHIVDTTLTGLKKDDIVSLVTWDFSDVNARLNIHTAFNVNNVSYAYNGCYPYGDNNAQGTNGWYQLFATSITEVMQADYRDMTALEAEIEEAEKITDLSVFTTDSVNAYNSALATARSMTKSNSQAEINAAASALKNAVSGLTLKPVVTPDNTVAFSFTEKLMTWDSVNNCWTAGEGKGSTTYAAFSELNNDNSALAIRKFVASESGSLKLAWGLGASVNVGTAKFAIADKDKNIIHGPISLNANEAHTFEIDIENVESGDAFYFIVYDATVDGACGSVHTAVNLNYVGYADNGNLWSSAGVQGDKGFYYIYTDDFIKRDVRNETMQDTSSDSTSSEDTSSSESSSDVTSSDGTSSNDTSSDDMSSDTSSDNNSSGGNSSAPDNTVAFSFTEKLMTWDSTNNCWTAGEGKGSTAYAAFSELNSDNSALAIRKFVASESGSLKLAWGLGASVNVGSAKFAIADKDKNILHGPITLNAQTAHTFEIDIENVESGDAFYFIVYDATVDGACGSVHTAVNLNYVGYADNGNLWSSAGVQGDKGFYYIYTDDFTKRDVKNSTQAPGNPSNPDGPSNPSTPNTPSNPTQKDDTVAFEFTEKFMTYDSVKNCWTAGEGKASTTYAAFSELNSDNSALAIRKFVAAEDGTLKLAWGLGASVNVGTAKFAIADKYKKVVYGPETLTAGTAHTFELEIADVKKGDAFYFIVYDATVDGVCASVHTAVNLNATAYADNGNLWSSANLQGENGFYYIYADDFRAISKTDYKNLDELNEQIKIAEEIPESTLSKCSDDSLKTFKEALKKAKNITKANTQAEIDAAADALKKAIKGLVPKSVPSNIKSVSFAAEKMVYNKELQYWTAKDDSSCIIGPAINISSTVSGSGNIAVRKLTAPSDGDMVLKWGEGVFIDNTSGNFTGATAEFMIVDKNGNILYPAEGGAAKITEGTPTVIDFEVKNVKRGDDFYFITLNPSVENLPVIYNFGVAIGGKALQNESGNLYGIGGIQGAKNWYYLFVSNLNLSTKVSDTSVNEIKPDDSGEQNNESSDKIPETGDDRTPLVAIISVISAGACLLLLNRILIPDSKSER